MLNHHGISILLRPGPSANAVGGSSEGRWEGTGRAWYGCEIRQTKLAHNCANLLHMNHANGADRKRWTLCSKMRARIWASRFDGRCGWYWHRKKDEPPKLRRLVVHL